jgi:hypothetical protein
MKLEEISESTKYEVRIYHGMGLYKGWIQTDYVNGITDGKQNINGKHRLKWQGQLENFTHNPLLIETMPEKKTKKYVMSVTWASSKVCIMQITHFQSVLIILWFKIQSFLHSIYGFPAG